MANVRLHTFAVGSFFVTYLPLMSTTECSIIFVWMLKCPGDCACWRLKEQQGLQLWQILTCMFFHSGQHSCLFFYLLYVCMTDNEAGPSRVHLIRPVIQRPKSILVGKNVDIWTPAISQGCSPRSVFPSLHTRLKPWPHTYTVCMYAQAILCCHWQAASCKNKRSLGASPLP